MSLVLGLTGGIASGKSTVSRYFKSLEVPIVDADLIAREVMKAGSPTVSTIRKQFGDDVILDNGEIDRKRLGKIIFASSEKREQLNSIVQATIRTEILNQKNKLVAEKYPLVVLDVPLLYEESFEQAVDLVMVVYVDVEIQKERLLKRNPELSEIEAENRIQSQMPLDKKAALADVVIDNNGAIEETIKQVNNWVERAIGG